MDDPTWLVTGYGWSRDTPPHQHPQLYLHDTQHGRTRTAALIEELDFIRGQDKHRLDRAGGLSRGGASPRSACLGRG